MRETETMSARQAAQALRCSVATVSRMAQDGRLTPLRSEPFYLFDRDDVVRVANERQSA